MESSADVSGVGEAEGVFPEELEFEAPGVYLIRWIELPGVDEEYGRDSFFVQFVDASGTEEHDLTSEIEEEAQEHIVCFDATTSNLNIVRTDTDGDYEVGLASEWSTSDAVSDASVTISLKHQPDVKDGTCDPGASDVEVSFPLIIE